MKRLLMATTILAFAGSAHAQIQTSSLGGMSYYLLPASGGCSAATPCSVVTYLSVQSESAGATLNDINTYFGGAFAQANPHTIVIAPVENGPQDATTNWGGYSATQTPEGSQMVAIVQSVEASMGNTVDPANSVVTGGSLGGTGTQNALAAYGPKGLVQQGVFSAGLSFDAALWTATNPSVVAALCGVPLTAVHGTADTNQSITYDQNLGNAINSNSACGNSFTLVPVQGAGHGTWSGSSGYQAGTGAGTPLAWISSQLSSSVAPVVQTTLVPVSASAVKAVATSVPVAAAPSQITPGSGSIIDAQGHVWAITAAGRITKDGNLVDGGGDTSNLTLMDGIVWGKDNGNDATRANNGGWFTLSSDGWQASTTPPAITSSIATASPTSAVIAKTFIPPAPVCGSAATANTFSVSGGQIIGPNGVFVARGINLYSPIAETTNNGSLLVETFPGLNFVRFIVRTLDAPSSYDAFVNNLTAMHVVIEFENHPDGGGGMDLSPPQGIAVESAWYAAMASHFAANPYVWFGTFNEAGTSGGSLSAWQKQTYDAVRSGSNTILMVEVSNVVSAMVPSIFGAMHNVVWDQHIYDLPNVSAINGAIATDQTVHSADGVVPVIIGEMGPSTPDGSAPATNGIVTIESLINIASGGTMGGLALFTWWPGFANANNLTDEAGTPTVPYGQMAQVYIGVTHQTCTAEQTAANVNATLQAGYAALNTQEDPTITQATATNLQPTSAIPTPVTDASVNATIEQIKALQSEISAQ